MSKYLITTSETYRVDSESEAKQLIEDAKTSNLYELKKYTSEYKEKKQKGEVIDAWWKVVLTKTFSDEKEPMGNAEVKYESGSAF